MAGTHRWQRHKETRAFLVALDISGFSRHMDEPDQLLEHRERFFRAIEQTSLFAQTQQAHTVVSHFLGDELRLAFCDSVGVQAVHAFVNEVLAILARSNQNVVPARWTRVKGVVLNGVVIWRTWRKCDYLDGPLPFKAQRWMTHLQPGEIAVDNGFKNAMRHEAIPTGTLLEQDFTGEPGYLLQGEGRR